LAADLERPALAPVRTQRLNAEIVGDDDETKSVGQQ
jgi:hypothetical protein